MRILIHELRTTNFGTNAKVLIARILHYTRLESLAKDKRTSLLGPFVRYEENVVLRLLLLSWKLKNGSNKLVCFSMTGLYSLVLCIWVRLGAYPRVD